MDENFRTEAERRIRNCFIKQKELAELFGTTPVSISKEMKEIGIPITRFGYPNLDNLMKTLEE